MALDLKELKERLENKKSSGGFIKLPKGETVLRIVPGKNNDSFRDFHLHYGVGNVGGFLCPKKNYGEPCPACDFASSLWREGTDESKQLAKSLFAQERHYSPVLVRGEESKGVRWWSYGKTVRDFLIGLCLNPDYGDITHEENGTDLVISVSQKDGDRFAKPTVQPKRKTSRLCDGMTKEQCQEVVDSTPDIMSLMYKKTAEEIQQLLNEHFMSEEAAANLKPEIEKYGNKSEENKEPAPTDIESAFSELLNDQ